MNARGPHETTQKTAWGRLARNTARALYVELDKALLNPEKASAAIVELNRLKSETQRSEKSKP
jgi:hypothetical protein